MNTMNVLTNVELELDNGKEVLCDIEFDFEDGYISLGRVLVSNTTQLIDEDAFSDEAHLINIIMDYVNYA